MKSRILLALVLTATAASAVDYKTQIAPIFRNKCYACHSVTKKVKGKLALDDAELPKQIGPGKHIIPGEAMKSTMFVNCTLPDDDADVMPPEGKNRLTDAEIDLLKNWIAEGASLTGGGAAPAPTPAAAPAVMPAAGGLLKMDQQRRQSHRSPVHGPGRRRRAAENARHRRHPHRPPFPPLAGKSGTGKDCDEIKARLRNQIIEDAIGSKVRWRFHFNTNADSATR
jgi:mono/diheme cytochrome c family protein